MEGAVGNVLLVGLFWGAFSILALIVAYLLLLTVAAFFARRRSSRGDGRARFALMIPAHNEEAVLSGVLESLNALDYPRECYAVFVVADNSTAATAAGARRQGAHVFERFDDRQRGKGYALQWLLERIVALGSGFDAYVIFDADSRVDPAFLRVMEVELARGEQALQASYGVLNPDDGPGAALRGAAMSLVNHVRPLGKNALGCSTGLKGNGMCFSAAVMEQYGWGAASLAEDAEHGVRLLLKGVRVRFVPQARVWAQMPPRVKQSESQNLRWEAGRLLVVRQLVPALLREGVRRRDLVLLEAAFDLLVPPLSMLVGGISLLALATFLTPWLWGARLVGGLLAAGLAAHVFIGFAQAGTPWRTLLHAPGYCLWKIALYIKALVRRPPTAWVRTRRFP
jgi:cellulose synthase/poly-beta-1,6-N-acetylglucosamine synthase-like glycosyltransferase